MWHPLVAELLIDAREIELTLRTRHHHDLSPFRGHTPARLDPYATRDLGLLLLMLRTL
jgi:hypothetical protein